MGLAPKRPFTPIEQRISPLHHEITLHKSSKETPNPNSVSIRGHSAPFLHFIVGPIASHALFNRQSGLQFDSE